MLTPALLVTIAILVVYAAFNPMAPLQTPAPDYAASPFTKGLIKCYDTMDALASLVFAIIVIDAVRGMGYEKKEEVISLTARAGIIAIAFLAIVYAFVTYLGATSVGKIGLQENGADVLAKAAHIYFGSVGNVLLAVIVLLACLSTSVGLITANGEYFSRLIPRVSYRSWIIIFTLISLLLANAGLSAMIKFAVPALMLLYPMTMVLIFLAFLNNLFDGRRLVYGITILGTLPVALVDGWRTLHSLLEGGKDAWIMQLDGMLKINLPLYSYGLGWIVPSAVAFVIGVILTKIIKKKAYRTKKVLFPRTNSLLDKIGATHHQKQRNNP